MKKKLFLRLCLILVVAITVYSCRTDQFPENETFNDSSKFQLTSKRISLNEAKHKAKLLPELQKAEKEVEKQKLNIQEKLVNIGNGITIDTDEVIYMENGPDFHTYTFSVIRDNAPVNAPVENLLLTPNPDGSYRVFHIVLNLTEADKARIAKKEYVDYKNKEQVTELESINFSSLSQKRICIPHYYSYPVSCKEGLHEPGEPCAYAGTSGAAYWGSIVLYDCFGEEPETIMPTPTPGDGGGGGGGECPDCPDNNTPEPCVQIATDPTQVGIIDPNGCIVGLPTDPNLPLPTIDPCRKTKASVTAANNLLKNPDVQTQMDAVLKGKISAPNEFGMKVGDNGNSSYSFSNLVEGTDTQTDLSYAVLPSGNYIADGHSHRGGDGTPSGGDLYNFMALALTNPHLKYRFVYGLKGSNPEVYTLVINDVSLFSNFLAEYPKADNYDPATRAIRRDSKVGKEFYTAERHYSAGRSEDTSGENYNANAVAMAYILEKYNTGISIAHVDSNGNLKKINAIVQEITVPNSGAKKEGVKVSKCP